MNEVVLLFLFDIILFLFIVVVVVVVVVVVFSFFLVDLKKKIEINHHLARIHIPESFVRHEKREKSNTERG